MIAAMPLSERYALDALLPTLHTRWQSGAIGAAAYAASFFLGWHIAAHGPRYASRRSRYDPRPDAAALWAALFAGALPVDTLADLLERHQYLGVIPNATSALAQWLRGNWPLVLREDIPEPSELLRLQAAGTRVVTVISDPVRRHLPIMHKANAFAFMVHDLEHAYQFLHDADMHQQQCAFFGRLLQLVEHGWFEFGRSEREFADKFNYVMSDMNTHPAHSVGYLRAIVIEYFLRCEGKPAAAPLTAENHAAVDRLLAPFAEFVPHAITETRHAVASARAG